MRLNLLKKMLLYILGSAVLGLVILAVTVTFIVRNDITKVTDTQLQALAKIQASELNNIMLFLETLVASTSEVPAVGALALTHRYAPNSPRYAAELEELNAFFKDMTAAYANVADVFLTDTKGSVIAHSQSQFVGFDASRREAVIGALRGTATLATVMSESTKTLSAFIASPVRDGGEVLGALVILVNLKQLHEVTTANVILTPGMGAYVYDKEFTILMDEEDEFINSSDAGLAHVQEMAVKKFGKADFVFEDVRYIGYYAHVPTVDWYVFVETPYDELNAPVAALTFEIALLALGISLVITAIIFVVAKGIANNLKASASIATYVSEGNLVLTSEQKQQLNDAERRGDEISELAAGLSQMISNLAEIVEKANVATNEAKTALASAEEAQKAAQEAAEQAGLARRQGLLDAARQLEGVVHVVASASEQLSAQIESSTNSVNDQAARLGDTAAGMDQMNSTIIDVTQNAVSSAEIANTTREKAMTGAEITQRCKDAINSVRKESLTLRTNMNALADHAQSINTVMGVISDIADQTNLLALNAAIEAARAGEAGRGFAVVADEVRKLAEKTITSTTDVANAITAIQHSTEQNVHQVDVAVQGIEEATTLANESGIALQEILEMAEMSAGGVRNIATASEEQSVTMEEMTRAIDHINNVANDTRAAMDEASSAVIALSSQAQELTNIVENLKNN